MFCYVSVEANCLLSNIEHHMNVTKNLYGSVRMMQFFLKKKEN